VQHWRLIPEVGVDLGTANTLVYLKGQGIVLNEPSIVAIRRDDRRVVAVGLEAKRMLGRTSPDVVTVRPLRGGVIAQVDVAETMIRRYLEAVTHPGVLRLRPRPRLVVGVPSGITELERRAVRSAAASAGAREVFMISEPVAAALGVGLPVDTPAGSMVIDIGAGTTEIAVIALGGVVADTSIRIAGDELDQALLTWTRQTLGLLIGEATAEALKMTLASAAATPTQRAQVRGRDLVSGVPKSVWITSDDVRGAIREPVQQVVDAVIRALELTPPELAADIVDNGLRLTGGGALIRGLGSLIEQRTGLRVIVDEDPLTCVVRGTGIVLDNFERYRGILSR
jgi:rod shape-determining protein MreB and related proteins